MSIVDNYTLHYIESGEILRTISMMYLHMLKAKAISYSNFIEGGVQTLSKNHLCYPGT